MTQNASGWTKDGAQLIAWQVLVWLVQQPYGYTGDTAPFREANGISEENLLPAMRQLLSEGFTEPPELMVADQTWADVTNAGHVEAQRIKTAWSDRSARAIACREAVLDWLYENEVGPNPSHYPVTSDFIGDTRAYFLGDPFTESEVGRAAGFLKTQGLVDGFDTAQSAGLVRSQITAEGIRRVEEQSGRLYAPATPTQSFTNVVHGSVGQIAQGSHFQQAQTVGTDPEALRFALQAVAAAVEELGEDDRAAASRALATIEDEAADGFPEPGTVRRRMKRLQEIAERVGIAAFASAVGQLVKALGRQLLGG